MACLRCELVGTTLVNAVGCGPTLVHYGFLVGIAEEARSFIPWLLASRCHFDSGVALEQICVEMVACLSSCGALFEVSVTEVRLCVGEDAFLDALLNEGLVATLAFSGLYDAVEVAKGLFLRWENHRGIRSGPLDIGNVLLAGQNH